jgi:hypothetical protein
MKKLPLLFSALCMTIFPVMQSCDNSDGYSVGDFTYPDWATVKVIGDAFYLDSDYMGSLWLVNTNLQGYIPVDGQRVLAVYTPLSDQFEGYDHAVKLLDLRDALTKEAERWTEEMDEEWGHDPLLIDKGDITISGGYLNVIFRQNLPTDPNNKHRISLVGDAVNFKGTITQQVPDDYIHLDLRYNTYGDVSGHRAYGLVSFKLSELNITEETKGIKLKLNSEVNGEVELTFNKTSSDNNNTKRADNLDFSKMQLK